MSECCWHGEVDGIVPVLLPLDGADVPTRFVLASKPEALTLPQTCCRCSRRRVRSWAHKPSSTHKGQLDLVDVTAASGPCHPPAFVLELKEAPEPFDVRPADAAFLESAIKTPGRV